MAEPARAQKEHGATTDGYAPYGQIIKMLLPSVGSIAIYGADGELAWCSDGFERPDLREVVEQLSTDHGLSASGEVALTSSGAPAFAAGLRGESGELLGSLVVELDRDGASRSRHSMIVSMLRPVLDCVAGRMNLHRAGSWSNRPDTAALDLLVSVDDDDRNDPSALQQLLRNCVQQLGCAMGSFVVPDKNVSLSATFDASLGNFDVIDRTRKHLLAWAQLNNRPMVVNRMAKGHDVAPYKILSCPVRDIQGQVIGVVALFRGAEAEDFELRDIRILEFVARKAVAMLKSHHDPLTGLVNRAIFERRAQRLLDAEDSPPVSVLYIDIDKLADFNESFGLQSGDEVIQRVADIVRRASAEAMASRLGGDRFAVLLPQTSVSAAAALGQRILSTAAQLAYMRGSEAVPVGLSIGATQARGASERIAYVLAAAELACKRAKQKGGNRLETSEGQESTPSHRQLQAIAASSLREALKANDFSIESQPVVRLSGERETLGHELLLRMRDAGGRLLSPDKFFDAAERSELMPAIDRWVVCSGVEGLRSQAARGTPMQGLFFVNVSAQSLVGRNYADFALEQIAAAGLSASQFCFELKEAAAVIHVAAAEQLIRELTAAGCRVALDDFGCGLSSLAHLKRLPVHYLKIDGRLVRRVLSDRIAESIVSGIARAAATLGVSTIGEHVEDAATAERLRELDVQYGQGFHFGRPKPFASTAPEPIRVS